MQSIIGILNIDKRSGEIPKEFVYLDPNYITIPDVTNMDLKEAKKALKQFTVKTEGKGKVIYQSPPAGTKINEKDTVRIYLK